MIFFSCPSFFGFFIVKERYDIGKEMIIMNKKLVPSSITYLFSMQGTACRTWTLRGVFPLGIKGVNLQRIYERHYLTNAKDCWGKRLIKGKREPTLDSTMKLG
jgi:hypothetical protein